jgi:hypothetical protein
MQAHGSEPPGFGKSQPARQNIKMLAVCQAKTGKYDKVVNLLYFCVFALRNKLMSRLKSATILFSYLSKDMYMHK